MFILNVNRGKVQPDFTPVSVASPHRVTLRWERWWMPLSAPSRRWRSTSRRYCGDTALAPDVMKRSSKRRSQGLCSAVSSSYLWVHRPSTLWSDAALQPCQDSLFCISALVQGICMIIGGIKHREQRFNSRSAGVSSALLFISIGGILHHPPNANFNKAFWKVILTQEQKRRTYFFYCAVHRCVRSDSVFKDIRRHGVWQLLRHPRQHHCALHLQRLSLRHSELLILTLHLCEFRIQPTSRTINPFACHVCTTVI